MDVKELWYDFFMFCDIIMTIFLQNLNTLVYYRQMVVVVILHGLMHQCLPVLNKLSHDY